MYAVNRLCTLTSVQYSYKVKEMTLTNQYIFYKEVRFMCMTKKELENKINELKGTV